MKILFMGDSITDAGRNTDRGSMLSIGQGYAMLVCAGLGAKYPGKFEFVNTGVSGNRVVDIYARIKKDMWAYAPDVLSILIGINDVWHEVSNANGVDGERFENVYRMYIADTLKRFPGMKIIAMEPFVLKDSATEENWDYFSEETKIRSLAVKKVSDEFGLIFMPLQEMFNEACRIQPAGYWLADGVHPTPAGHELIAEKWIETFEKEILR